MKRRNFLVNTIIGGIGLTGITGLPAIAKNPPAKKRKVLFKLGICADLHQDIMPDGPQRLQTFITAMNEHQPDFIIQMGDLCVPKPSNQVIMDIWNQFKGPKYHVIGNHDTDGGYTHDQVVNFWNARDKYYSFDTGGYHFIVLNANEEKQIPKYQGPPSIISDDQKKWLEQDIAGTNLPVIVFCHQGLDNDTGGGVYQGNLIRVIFDRANVKAGYKKVQMVFSGHHHQDYYNVINGVHYVQVNSISYQYMGPAYAHAHYDSATEQAHPSVKYTAPYKDPIWAFLTIYSDGTAKITGRKSVFLSPAPQEMQRPEFHSGYPDVPYISDRDIHI
ncbi:putative phosphodiesterase [Pedobacter cryoconitis]|uniref:Putative phosphodiesterase n=1 Tax=Pedobacter cryoconitis TaxID=188932 RepID=A0A7W8ZNZ7_9SPHI|nr:metallophosphoesterase [Pedobacter cryoconitis]MBB5637292.1 putative phosphodiesterase [Pedobacter cryoconitis]